MASLALGLLGGYLFGPVGFLAGSFLGNLLDPAKVEGPRLKNLRLQTSQYGQMLPLVWGTVRVPGNVIWQTSLTEHASTSGGKGGPEVTTYTYSASFATAMCAGPILGVRRIWADSRLIWGTGPYTVSGSSVPVTVYLGDTAQTADPTMQAALGVANVPGFRDTAYAVFANWDLSQFGNRIPSLEFEVFTVAGPIPTLVSHLSSSPFLNPDGATYDRSTGNITVGAYDGSGNYVETVYNLLSGAQLSSTSTPCDLMYDPLADAFYPPGTVGNPNVGTQQGALSHNGFGVQQRWYSKQYGGVYPDSGPESGQQLSVDAQGAYGNGYVYSVDMVGTHGNWMLEKWPTDPTGIVNGPPLLSAAAPNLGRNAFISIADTGDIFIQNATSGTLLQLDGTGLGIKHSWTLATLPPAWNNVGGPVTVYNGLIAVTEANSFSGESVVAYKLAGLSASSVPIGTLQVSSVPSSYGIAPLSGGYAILYDAVVSLDPVPGPVPLSKIVSDISVMCGLSTSQIDVSQLTDLVDGYVIDQQSDGRNMIQPLRNAYFFDAVESSGVVKFPKRNSAPVVTIPQNDLAAFESGSGQPPPLLQNDRTQDVDIPMRINLRYMNVGADYQEGTQYSQRQVTNSQSVTALDLPIVLTDTQAKAIVDANLTAAWVEREKYTLFTSRAYAYLEPTDVIVAQGREMRIVTREEVSTKTIKFEALATLQQVYQVAGVPAGSTGFVPQLPPAAPAATDLALLDVPLLVDSDTPQAGYYYAMSALSGDAWAGASLDQSIDGGSSYNPIATADVQSVMGVAVSILGAWDPHNNIPDAVNSVIVASITGGALAGVTLAAMLNGANTAVLGNEVLQFQNATLIAANRYQLSGLLRGRRGTEWAMAAHGLNEQFVLLPVERAAMDQSQFFLDLYYKGVTFGQAIAAATAIEFENSGVALKPYAPVLLAGGTDASGNVTLQWVYRTRIGGAWQPYVDVTPSEPYNFAVQIWNGAYTLCARIVTGLAASSLVYTAAMQTADFGALQKTIYFTVNQVGSLGPGYRASGTGAGAGGSNGNPLSPVTPLAGS